MHLSINIALASWVLSAWVCQLEKDTQEMAEWDVWVPGLQGRAADNGGGGSPDSVLLIKELASNVSQVTGLLQLTSVWLSKEGDLAGFPRAVISAQGAGRLQGLVITQNAAAITWTLLPSNVQTKAHFKVCKVPQYPTQTPASFSGSGGAAHGVHGLVNKSFGQHTKRTVYIWRK